MSQVSMAVRCHWCSRQRQPHQVFRLASGQHICEYCLDWHMHALDFLGGATPRGCQVCERPWDMLYEQAGDEVRMYVVPKDGIYQLLCASCAAPYVVKRPDLYRGTQFGKELKL